MAHADAHGGSDARHVDRDVACRIAAADDQYALICEGFGPLVFARMQHLAGELAGVVGQQRFAMMTGTDDEIIEGFGACPVPADDADGPPAVGEPFCAFDARVEPDLGEDAKALGIGPEIVEHLPTRGKIRVVRRHRKILELGKAFRGDQPGGAIDASLVRIVVIDPVPANRGRFLVADMASISAASRFLTVVSPQGPAPMTQTRAEPDATGDITQP